MTELTQKRLKELLRYNPETGLFTWVHCGEMAGRRGQRDYIHIRVDGDDCLAHRLAFLYMEGSFPEQATDHINHIRHDNRWANIRRASHTENRMNASKMSNNTSGFNGVSWSKACNKWSAQIKVGGKKLHLGVYDDIKCAISARKAANVVHGFHENHGKWA